jgi:far upstream element-binding protein
MLTARTARQPSTTPSQTPQQQPPAHHPPPPGLPMGFPGALQNPTPPGIPGYNLPHPTHTGSVDLSGIKPINSGSVNVSIQDALAKARGFAAEKGLSYSAARPSAPTVLSDVSRDISTDSFVAPQEDLRRQYQPRSRSPPRNNNNNNNMRDSYDPYRDERRGDSRRGAPVYGRERSRSPPRRDTFSPPRNFNARERSPPPSDNSEVILIDSSLVGLVIGRQGESLRRIEQESGTRIQFINGPDSGPQRQCRITGNMSARIAAKREINRIIEENGGNPARETGRDARSGSKGSLPAQVLQAGQQPALREGEQSSQIMVPDRTVGLIIGRGGETIRDLQERSGCHVNIVGENKSVNGLRPVNLIGSPVAAARAKELIMEIVDSDTKPAGEAPPPTINISNNKRDTFDPYASGPNKINESIYVPSDAVGMIIGKGKLLAVFE